jgi:hypothetical protein
MQILSSFTTDQGLLDAVRAAPERRSPHEVFEQKVSFVFGSMDRNNSMTKEQVREVMLKQAGEPMYTR